MNKNKTLIMFVVFLAVFSSTLIASGNDVNLKENQIKNIPNSGYVSNKDTALQIGNTILNYLLNPDDFNKKEFSEAELENGIWTIRYWEAKNRINFPIIIKIRQKTGAIISYDNPNE